MTLDSIVAFWKVEKTTITGMFSLAMFAVMATGAIQGPHHINWPSWLDQIAWWTVGPGAALFTAYVKTRGVTGGTVTTTGAPAPPVTLVEAAQPGAPDVPVQPVAAPVPVPPVNQAQAVLNTLGGQPVAKPPAPASNLWIKP